MVAPDFVILFALMLELPPILVDLTETGIMIMKFVNPSMAIMLLKKKEVGACWDGIYFVLAAVGANRK